MTEAQEVDFYEREFYPLSNFSSFTLMWETSPRAGFLRFDTSEAVYHWEKFKGNVPTNNQRCIQAEISLAASAHEAFKIAERNRQHRRPNWDDEKVDVMRKIIRAKAEQHEYVRRKLLETGDRPLIEGSWRDDFWGIGPNRDGKNMLGKLWMELRTALRASAAPTPDPVDWVSAAKTSAGLSIDRKDAIIKGLCEQLTALRSAAGGSV